MLTDCNDLPGEQPEITWKPKGVIHTEQKIKLNSVLPGDSFVSESAVEFSHTNICKDNVHSMQHTPNINTRTQETIPVVSECTNIASRCDHIKEKTARPQDRSLEKTDLDRYLEQSVEYIDCDKEKEQDNSYKVVCNGSIESSQFAATGNTTNSAAVSIDSAVDDSVLGAGRSNLNSGTSSIVCFRNETESPCAAGNTAESTQESVNAIEGGAGGNETFKPGELTNQLIEGPRITLPPSQLPVISSYTSQHPQNQKHSPSSASSTSGMQSLTGHFNSAQGQSQDPSSCSSAFSHNESSKLTPVYIIPREASENISGSEDRKSIVQTTASVASDSQREQAASSTVSPADAASADKPKPKRTPNDFVFGKVIGEGSYSTVYLAKEVSTQREFAIKVCDKKHLIRERKTHFVMREKEVLMKLDHPFFIKLAYTFQDSERLYYVLTYARNGELLGYLHKLSAFDVPCTRFYSAEIVLALEYLHGLGIIHRDLKPENILLSEDMHIKITDFGTSKVLSLDSEENQVETKRKNSFVGTAEYVSPEVLNNQPANFGSDLWALGCIIYQCLSGSMPFRSGNEYQTFQKIVKAEYEFPEGFHPQAKDLVQKLLVLDPSARLGMAKPQGMKALKDHSFFEGIDWETLPESTPPKLMPYLPATANNPEFWGQEQRTGFDDQRFAEIITGQSGDGSMSPELEELPIKVLSQAEDAERAEKLRKQRLENPFHPFVKDHLIIKQGFVDKRKGLFARKRMLLLTEGPHLYYVDAHNKVLKGEIPWSKYLRPEAKNFKIFFVHTPNRTYYLESRQPDAQDWVKQIREVWRKYYDSVEGK